MMQLVRGKIIRPEFEYETQVVITLSFDALQSAIQKEILHGQVAYAV
jgi:hypothetical protein